MQSAMRIRDELQKHLVNVWKEQKLHGIVPLQDGFKIENDTLIVYERELGSTYDAITQYLADLLETSPYQADYRETYTKVFKSASGQEKDEATILTEYERDAAFWQQYNAMLLAVADKENARVIPNLEDKTLTVIGDAPFLHMLIKWLRGELKNDARQTYCTILGRPQVSVESIQTDKTAYTDRNSSITFATHKKLITKLAQTYVWVDQHQVRVTSTFPMSPRQDETEERKSAGKSLRYKLMKMNLTVNDIRLYIKNSKWEIRPEIFNGEIGATIPDPILNRALEQKTKTINDGFWG